MYNDHKASAVSILDFETELVRHIADGDSSAFEKLRALYSKRVYVFVRELLGRDGPAEEAANDAFHAIWRSAGRFNGNSAVSTWILGIARNVAMNRLRRRKPRGADSSVLDTVADHRGPCEDDLLRKDLVRKALRQLPRKHREVINLVFYLGMSYQEVAEVTRCPVNTVKTRMFHARKRLFRIIGSLL